MNQSKIVTRYAKAAFEFALEKNEHVRLHDDIKSLSKVLIHNHNLSEYLNNTVINNTKKIHTVETIFADAFSTLTMDFIRLVINNDRESYIPAMCRHIEKLFKQHENIHSLKLCLAHELDANVKQKISDAVKQALNANSIEMEESIDENIIGGFILKTEEFMYDASLKKQLVRIKNSLIDI
ncbi:MAG: ATP synthase F1 subunit delta [Bacteroidota bacterium]|nr:ATP synthase F1 subunit delta [Bacteroidota bacterium]